MGHILEMDMHNDLKREALKMKKKKKKERQYSNINIWHATISDLNGTQSPVSELLPGIERNQISHGLSFSLCHRKSLCIWMWIYMCT